MKRCKTFSLPKASREANEMSIDIALEDIAIGEADLAAASRTVAACLKQVDEDSAHELYGALRAWLWKTLEARRRDEELEGWLELFARVSSHLSTRWVTLATKLDGFAELLQASIMLASVSHRRDLMTRKHVREMLSTIYGAGGRLPRQSLVQSLGLKDANLTRVAAPLHDEGWIQREVVGREVFYRLTEKGKASWLPVIARELRPIQARQVRHALEVRVIREVHLDAWKEVASDRTGAPRVAAHHWYERGLPVRIDGLGQACSEDENMLTYEPVAPKVVKEDPLLQVVQ